MAQTNFRVWKDSNTETQTSTVATKLPQFENPLPLLAYSEQGNLAFDTTLRQLAYFDGLVWVYLTNSGAITNIVNIGNGAQVFETFNPNLPNNKVARLRTLVGGGGITITQLATTIMIRDGGNNVTNVTNIGGGAGIFDSFNPNIPNNKDAQLKSLVAGDGITITPTATTIEIAASAQPFFEYSIDTDVVVPENTSLVLATPNVTWTLINSNVGVAFNNGIFTASGSLAGNWQFGIKGAFEPIAVESNGASGLSAYHNFPNTDWTLNLIDSIEGENGTVNGFRIVDFGVRMGTGDTMRFTANNVGTGAGSKVLQAVNPTSIRCWGFRTGL